MLRDETSLIDIFTSINLILDYSKNISYQELKINLEKQDAILRRIIIIGEATKRLSTEFRLQHPTIPWKKIAGMRDVVTHNYDEVDIEEIWRVIQVNLPELLTYIKPLLQEHFDDII